MKLLVWLNHILNVTLPSSLWVHQNIEMASALHIIQMSGGPFSRFAIHEIATFCSRSAEMGVDLSRDSWVEDRGSRRAVENTQNNWLDTLIRSFGWSHWGCKIFLSHCRKISINSTNIISGETQSGFGISLNKNYFSYFPILCCKGNKLACSKMGAHRCYCCRNFSRFQLGGGGSGGSGGPGCVFVVGGRNKNDTQNQQQNLAGNQTPPKSQRWPLRGWCPLPLPAAHSLLLCTPEIFTGWR